MNLEPSNFNQEKTTIWSFPERGNWATHSGEYRGNWSPYVPRNLILKYTREGDWILDQFLGSGTTLIEAKLLLRNAIGVDINPVAIDISKQKLDFPCFGDTNIIVRQGNATSMPFILDESIDLICTHPPYANSIRYSEDIVEDISSLNYIDFLHAIVPIAEESFRVLKHNAICAFMIGDIRQHGNVKPLGFNTMEIFAQSGFRLKEIIIKEQHNCRSTSYWRSKNTSFYLLAHEYIFIMQKT